MILKTGLIATIFGTLLISSIAAAAAATAEEEKTWSYSQTGNPVNGGTIHQAQAVLPDLTVSVRCSTVNPLIEVRFFLARSTLDSLDAVRWQFDATAPRTDRWARSSNGRSLILPSRSRDPFLRLLKAYDTLSLTIVAADGDEVVFEIPLSGSSAAISKVADRCR